MGVQRTISDFERCCPEFTQDLFISNFGNMVAMRLALVVVITSRSQRQSPRPPILREDYARRRRLMI